MQVVAARCVRDMQQVLHYQVSVPVKPKITAMIIHEAPGIKQRIAIRPQAWLAWPVECKRAVAVNGTCRQY